MDGSADAAWLALVDRARKPIYAAIADAIREGVATGRLPPGTRLPPQRQAADRLAVDLTTVTRAYDEARRRGLVTARVGRGTFIAPSSAEAAPTGGLVDMSMNLPPQFDDPGLVRRMWAASHQVAAEQGLGLLMRYQSALGTERDRAAGVAWLRPRLPEARMENTVISAGAQAALVAVLSTLAEPGQPICAEALAYPGLRSAAAHLRLPVVGVAMDAEGIIPSEFARICREVGPKVLCCTPTLQNPTTATMSLERREVIVHVARRYRVAILEDDAYGPLPQDGLPPLAALAPELTCHVAGLAKVVSPALRIAYVVAPDGRRAARIAAVLRAVSGMASPLTAALATRWIEHGVAGEVLKAIRAEAMARRSIAAALLGDAAAHPAEAFHLWLTLPKPWTRVAFQSELRAQEVAVVPSDAFATTPHIPEAVRIGLGAAPTRADLRRALSAIGELLAEEPSWSSGYI